MSYPKGMDFNPFDQKDLPDMTEDDWKRLEDNRKERFENDAKIRKELRDAPIKKKFKR